MSTARSAREAVSDFQSQLQLTLDCITAAVVVTQGNVQRGPVRHLQAPIAFVLAGGNRVALSAPPTLYLEAALNCVVSRRFDGKTWAVAVTGYAIALREEDGAEVVAYHWHPQSTPRMANPHLHLGPASSRRDSTRRPGEMHKVHFPTGIVSLEDVIWLAITEFGVEPRRPDWEAILSRTG